MANAEKTDFITVEVAYATPERQRIVTATTTANTPLIDVVKQSGITDFFPALDLAAVDFGIWSKVMPPNTPIQDGQRIEIYRPLIADPKESRRQRAEKRPKQQK